MPEATGSIIGRETGSKPFPRIVHMNAHLFADVRTVIDIGAGTGRFAKYFLLGEYRCSRKRPNSKPSSLYEVKSPINFPITRYVAIEPYPLFCAKLQLMVTADPRLEVVCDLWENVRGRFMYEKFDIVIAWDVGMYMDLRSVHRTDDPVEAVLREIDIWVNMASRYFLFSLHPVSGVIPKKRLGDILRYTDTHPRLKLIAKSYLNRIYEVVP